MRLGKHQKNVMVTLLEQGMMNYWELKNQVLPEDSKNPNQVFSKTIRRLKELGLVKVVRAATTNEDWSGKVKSAPHGEHWTVVVETRYKPTFHKSVALTKEGVAEAKRLRKKKG